MSQFLDRVKSFFRTDTTVGGQWSIVSGDQPSEFQRNGREVRQIGWEKNGVVQGCVRAIVDVLAAVDYEVCRAQPDGSLNVIPGHEAANLLNLEPRLGTTGHTLRAQTCLYYLLYGNAFWVIERGFQRKATGVRLVHPERIMYAYLDQDDQITRYDWRDIKGVVHETAADDMLHLRDLSASPMALFGFPRAAAALTDMATDAEASAYVRQVVTNHGYPAAVVTTKGYTNKEELLRAEDSFNDRLTGRGRRGRSIFVNGEDVTFTPVGFNLTQLEFPDLRGIARETICSAFGIDPRMVGIGSAQASGGGFSGIEFREARFKLIQQAVMPVMKAIEAELNRWYMPEFGKGIIRFRADALSELTEDEQQTSTRMIAEVLAGIRTVEEARETIGLTAPMDPNDHFGGGNKTQVKVALAQAALDPVQKAKAMQAVVPNTPLPGRENGPGVNPKDATKPAGSLTAGATPPNKPPPGGLTEPPPNRLLRNGHQPLLLHGQVLNRAARMTVEDRTTYWRDFIATADKEEPSVLEALHHLFTDDWTRIAALFVGVGALTDVTVMTLLRSAALRYEAQGDIYQAWIAEMGPLVAEVFRSGIEQEVLAGHAPEALVGSARAQAMIRGRIEALVRQVTQTTFEQVRGLILVGRSQGQSPQEIADLIHQSIYGTAVESRAQLIARSEIVGALNQGGFLAALVGRQVQSKQWISQRDDHVRPSHNAAEEQGWIPVERAFNNGCQYPGDPHGGPSEVCNCRCTIAYTTETADAG